MKQFAKALDKSDACFRYICNIFPGLRREKAKVGIFDGPQICKLIKDQAFVSRITALVFVSRGSYVSVVQDFLGKTRADYYQDLAKLMLSKYGVVGARKSTNVYYLFSPLDRFPKNLVDLSEKQGERFH